MEILDWVKTIEAVGSLGLIWWIFAKYLPQREIREHAEREAARQENQALNARFSESVMKIIEGQIHNENRDD